MKPRKKLNGNFGQEFWFNFFFVESNILNSRWETKGKTIQFNDRKTIQFSLNTEIEILKQNEVLEQ